MSDTSAQVSSEAFQDVCYQLNKETDQLASEINEAIRLKYSFMDAINQSQNCVVVKAADGQVLFSNRVFDKYYNDGSTAVGRKMSAILEECVVPISEHSDQLLLRGCESIVLRFPGRDRSGDASHCYIAKRSLLGSGHPKIAILCVTRFEARVSSDTPHMRLNLAARYRIFERLDQRDRECAVMIASGKRSREIAALFGVSNKTVDNRRTSILRAFGLKNTMELTCLLCRFQDNGFCDFGL